MFSVANPNICILLSEIQVQSESFGWHDLLSINISDESQTPILKSMTHEHGQRNLEQACKESTRYIDSKTRKQQHNYQLFVCINHSIDDAAYVSTSELRTDNITLLPGSLQNAIKVEDSLEMRTAQEIRAEP